MKTQSFELRDGQLHEIQRSPEELAALQKKVSERFSPTGEDRVFTRMIARFKAQSKPKSLQPA